MNAAPGTTTPPRIALYEAEFADDPHSAYARMRAEHGPFVPVDLAPGLPATLVIGYDQARRILTDPARFPADPRRWEQKVPATCPVRPMMEWRPNALRSAGAAHDRYRSANSAALNRVDQHRLYDLVGQVASSTIAEFRSAGRADLLSQFASPIVSQVLGTLLGCPDDVGRRIADGMGAIFDGVNAEAGNVVLSEAVSDLVALRRRRPGDDITSRLLAHSTRLDDTEMAHQLVTLYGAAIEPLVNLITNALLKILTDEGFSATVHAGWASVREALDQVLYRDPPLANYAMSYPPNPVTLDGVRLPANEPVVISMAACNNDPAVDSPTGGSGDRAHLSWSAGPHACPARPHAYLIAETALTHLLDALPDMDLACPISELTWRPGPFHRALTRLPVRFPAA
ncbi:cytochrome P450 [Streptomyces violascens]|uniref:cytochrome P450 n=1 Tax=Streptomyces violascens TaxID=67381 RepID=UPI00167A9EA2|nr:cytochrome P450 [Streptomyces violascens]GGU38367.1 cytochrome P450 [Streptomyces violascens]